MKGSQTLSSLLQFYHPISIAEVRNGLKMWYQMPPPVLSGTTTLRLQRFWHFFLSSVWSKFMINGGGIWYLWTISIILWWKSKPASLMAPSGIFHLPVVAARLSNPILRKRLQAHSVFSKSIHLRCSSSSMTTLFKIPRFFCNMRK